MRVRCITNKISEIPEIYFPGHQKESCYGAGMQDVHLTVGKSYVVYALAESRLGKWVYVSDDDHPHVWYPLAYPFAFFETTDARISKLWTTNAAQEHKHATCCLRSFAEWTTDPSFYDRLVEKENSECAIFRDRKEFMDMEYPFDADFKCLTHFDHSWCQCPNCDYIWEDATHEMGMKRCPQCQEVLVDRLWAGPRMASQN